MMIDPNNGEEKVTYGIAKALGPERQQRSKRSALWYFQLQHENRADDREHCVRQRDHAGGTSFVFVHRFAPSLDEARCRSAWCSGTIIPPCGGASLGCSDKVNSFFSTSAVTALQCVGDVRHALLVNC